MKISQFIKVRREELGLSQEQLSNVLGYKSPMSISNIETGKSPFPLRRLDEFARALNINPEELNKLIYMEKVTEIGEILQVTTSSNISFSSSYIFRSSSTAEYRDDIPVIGMVEGGPNGEWDDSGYPVGEGRYRLPRPGDVTDENAFGLEITGESMVPRFEPGDVVIVSPKKQVFNGDYAVCRLQNGDSMIKRVRFRGEEVVLESINQSYPPIIMPRNKLVFCYKIAWIKPKQ